MTLCRCPHCGGTFQVHIPPESRYWDSNPVDSDGVALWVCLECHRQGRPPANIDDADGHVAAVRRRGTPRHP